MECVGIAGHACCLACLVRRALIKQLGLMTNSLTPDLVNLPNCCVPLLHMAK